MDSKDYYHASLYILAYLVAFSVLNLIFSFFSSGYSYAAEDSFVKILTSLFFIVLGAFAVYKLFYKSKLGFYSGFAYHGLQIVLIIVYFFTNFFNDYGSMMLDSSMLIWFIGKDITALILSVLLLFALWKAKPELN